jgi:hypothetical protein
VGDQARTDDDDRLREHREEHGVPERAAEVRIVPGAAEVVETDELAGERASRRVRQGEVEREEQRAPDERGDEDDGRADEHGREEAALLEEVAPPADGPRLCDGCHRAAILKAPTRRRRPSGRTGSPVRPSETTGRHARVGLDPA